MNLKFCNDTKWKYKEIIIKNSHFTFQKTCPLKKNHMPCFYFVLYAKRLLICQDCNEKKFKYPSTSSELILGLRFIYHDACLQLFSGGQSPFPSFSVKFTHLSPLVWSESTHLRPLTFNLGSCETGNWLFSITDCRKTLRTCNLEDRRPGLSATSHANYK